MRSSLAQHQMKKSKWSWQHRDIRRSTRSWSMLHRRSKETNWSKNWSRRKSLGSATQNQAWFTNQNKRLQARIRTNRLSLLWHCMIQCRSQSFPSKGLQNTTDSHSQAHRNHLPSGPHSMERSNHRWVSYSYQLEALMRSKHSSW